MKYVVLAVAAAIASTAAQAENWRVVGVNDDSLALVAFVDTDSVTRSGDDVGFVMRVYREGMSAETDALIVQQRGASCALLNYRVWTEKKYSGPRLLEENNAPSGIVEPPAGSMDAAMIKAACGTGNYQTGTIDNPADYADDYFAELLDEE